MAVSVLLRDSRMTTDKNNMNVTVNFTKNYFQVFSKKKECIPLVEMSGERLFLNQHAVNFTVVRSGYNVLPPYF